MDKNYYQIIKYDTSKMYFGKWSPRMLYDAFRTVREDPGFSTSIYTGKISYDLVCNVLSNEMSYNPLRFGETSPFIKNGKNNIHNFIKTYQSSNDKTMKNIADALSGFRYFAYTYDNNININGFISDSAIIIDTTDGIRPNNGYKMLSYLVKSLHIIASQNMNDFKKSKKFRDSIKSALNKRKYGTGSQNTTAQNVSIDKTQKEKIQKQILDMYDDIQATQMRIDNLSEYENPGADIKYEKNTLEQQQNQLELLERQLADIQHETFYDYGR